MLNIAVGVSPLFANYLGGDTFSALFPSLLMVFFVLIASSLYNLFKGKPDARSCTTKFAISLVWIILLMTLATKFPYRDQLFNYLFSGNSRYASVIVISVGSVLIAWDLYFPFTDFFEKEMEETINTSKKIAINQHLENTADHNVEW